MIKTSVLAMLVVSIIGTAQAASDCGTLENRYGPFDYSSARDRAEKLPVVEVAHYTTEVASLRSGKTAASPLPDLDYTLRAFPNHVPALYSMAMLQMRDGPPPLRSKYRSAHCYFLRATQFKPDDGAVYLVWGVYLHKLKKLDAALEKYQIAQNHLPDESRDLHYNLGLLHFDRKEYVEAKAHAIKAYELGHPLMGLKLKLQSAGAWQDK